MTYKGWYAIKPNLTKSNQLKDFELKDDDITICYGIVSY